MPRRHLIVVAAGRSSLHPRWLDFDGRTYDVVACVFDGSEGELSSTADHVFARSGAKWEILAWFFANHPDLWQGRDYIWLPDDDLACSGEEVNRMFAAAAEHELDIAQPSLTRDSPVSHEIVLHRRHLAHRRTNFVELMCPLFERAALQTVLPTFSYSRSGWGNDFLWCQHFLPDARIAIIDAVQVEHTRPPHGPDGGGFYGRMGIDPFADMRAAFRRHAFRPLPPAMKSAVTTSGVSVKRVGVPSRSTGSSSGLDPESPVVVGAVGGSGTRVVCSILKTLGVYMGITRLDSKDTIWFPDLLGWPDAFDTNAGLETPSTRAQARLDERLDLFHELMFSTFSERRWMTAWTRARWLWFRTFRMDPLHRERFQLSTRLNLRPLMRKSAWRRRHPDAYVGWGWKEPMSHVYLPQLLRRYPKMRYIHVVRHGLDMAFAQNDWQYRVWAPRFGLPGEPSPPDMFSYWRRVNERARRIIDEELGDRALILRFEDLISDPAQAIRAIAGLIGVDVDRDGVARLSELVKTPESIGRHKHADLTGFGDDDMSSLVSFGYGREP